MSRSSLRPTWLNDSVRQQMAKRPVVGSFLLQRGIELELADERPLETFLAEQVHGEAAALEELVESLVNHVHAIEQLVGSPMNVSELVVLGGHDKEGRAEPVSRVQLACGDILAIVGPTGSGKSRLLADIEWMAAGDTPTGRTILVDGHPAHVSDRHCPSRKLVAQLSQTMSFVVDLSVGDFLSLHAESRGVPDAATSVEETLDLANQLSGERFTACAPVSALSGGQSRALMIADVAVLGRSPVVLIDEIENAGIDRQRALDVLVSKEKIVLLATHDPLLALRAPRRLVLKNGGLCRMIERDAEELAMLDELEGLEQRLLRVRGLLRAGGRATDAG